MTEPMDANKARALLQQAERDTSAARGNASWPSIAMQLGLGASSSLYLFSTRDGREDHLLLVFMFVWWAFLMVYSTVFSRAAKRGFGRRWLIYFLFWSLCWTLGVFAVFPHAAVVCAVLILLATALSAVWEARL